MTPTEMELKVAKAAYLANPFRVDLTTPFEEITDSQKDMFVIVARAAIQAMRGDPGHDVTAALCKPGENRIKFVEIWQAMINAASPPETKP